VAGHDLLQWLALIFSGLLVSVLSERHLRAQRVLAESESSYRRLFESRRGPACWSWCALLRTQLIFAY
jgi:hypothetical protein